MLLCASRRVAAIIPQRTASRSLYSLHVAARWAGKPPQKPKRPLQPFILNPDIVAWRDKTLAALGGAGTTAGDDFLFTRKFDQRFVFAVADGVSGWSDQGIDPAQFSQALLYYAHLHSSTAPHPRDCLEQAYDSLLADNQVNLGSSTACILSLDAASGLLTSANLGDSGFCIVRDNAIAYTSPVQAHYFNCPHQLSKYKIGRGRNLLYNTSAMDSPRAADVHEQTLRDGDIIIAYTDGIFDNVWLGKRDGPNMQLALNIAHYARKRMFSDEETPFEVEARRNRINFPGGKVDEWVEHLSF
ncbi:Protein phosphatase [Mycena chlorophos]|uniref:Protein phosphatase n=1 Tax=Mycena chlorophos TaxID=658473 RepID=A0A8H6TUB8_MYCCL|nr:Protein phosphatase [Mycena chlorophos]